MSDERFKLPPTHGARPTLTDRPLVPREHALQIAFDFQSSFKENFSQIKCVIAGSIRREKEFVHDIDILIVSKDEKVIKWCKEKVKSNEGFFYHYVKGKLKDMDVQIWFCEESTYGPALLKWTGPQDFNRKLSRIAKRMGGTLSENGLFKGSPGDKKERLDENTESNIIWLILRRSWIHPRDRSA